MWVAHTESAHKWDTGEFTSFCSGHEVVHGCSMTLASFEWLLFVQAFQKPCWMPVVLVVIFTKHYQSISKAQSCRPVRHSSQPVKALCLPIIIFFSVKIWIYNIIESYTSAIIGEKKQQSMNNYRQKWGSNFFKFQCLHKSVEDLPSFI